MAGKRLARYYHGVFTDFIFKYGQSRASEDSAEQQTLMFVYAVFVFAITVGTTVNRASSRPLCYAGFHPCCYVCVVK